MRPETKQHWFVRYMLPVLVIAAMIGIPALSTWTAEKLDELSKRREKAKQLFVEGQAHNPDLDKLINEVSRGDWTNVPQEWRDAAHEILGPDTSRAIRQALQNNPPTQQQLRSTLRSLDY